MTFNIGLIPLTTSCPVECEHCQYSCPTEGDLKPTDLSRSKRNLFMHKIKPYLLNLFFTIPIIIFTLYSCASKPNIPYPGKMSENFSKLEQRNPLLASEIRKLPEFQNGVTVQKEKALDDLVELYANNPKIFSNAFEEMYQVGIPEIRKYCSPLQALFWLAEDGRNKEINEILEPYSLDRLLDKAWAKNKSTEKGPYIKVLQLTKEQVQSIIAKMSNEKQEFYEEMSPKTINDVILIQYKDNPRYFPSEIRKTIKSSLKEKPNKNYKNYLRWNDFNTVADRLNSPELVDYWTKDDLNLSYQYYRGDHKTNNYVFKSKRANCKDTTQFIVECLHRAGYKAGDLLVAVGEGHNICYYWDKGNLYVIDNANPKKGIRGPYNSFKEIPYEIIEFL